MVPQEIATTRERGERGDDIDAALIRAIVARDERALERLFRRYFRKLIGFAARVTARTDLAEEVASDTIMAVWRGAPGFEGRSRPSTWIFGIAYRIALKARDRDTKHPMATEAEANMDRPDEEAGRVLDALFLRRDVMRAMDALSPEHRTVIQLTYYYGYSYPEIAEIMDCPVGTVKSRMSHARTRLNQLLADPVGENKDAKNV